MALHYALLYLLLSPRVRAAINPDGSHATEPAISVDDPSPIDSPDTYYQEQHDCPLPCTDYANIHSWITYLSVDRLSRCKAPMLLQFSATQSLAGSPHALIRSCTLTSVSSLAADAADSVSPGGEPYATDDMENPKLDDGLIRVGVESAPACAVRGVRVADELTIATRSGQSGSARGADAAELIHGMREFFGDEDNCDESFLFAYYGDIVASVFIGAGLGKPTVESALDALAEHFEAEGTSFAPNRTVVEFCDDNKRGGARIFGISVDAAGDLAGVQRTALDWSKGRCSADRDDELVPEGTLSGAEVFDIAGADLPRGNSTATAPFHTGWRQRRRQVSLPSRAATCRYIKVESGDGCPSLLAKCGISAQDFVRFNPRPGLCGSLQPNDYVCCSAGDPYTPPPTQDPPGPGPDGTCATHVIQNGDTCDSLAPQHGVTIADLERWNQGKTWGWTKCEDMLLGYNMCLSAGKAPLPPPQEGTQCGPMVPGTRPSDVGDGSLADVNPCPLKACCSNWGFCGVFPAHCDVYEVPGGGPGSKPKDIQSTCVSNCGVDIKRNSGPPASFGRIGYYESWNLGRDCLWLASEDSNTDGSYTHIHWGFLDIDPNTWKPIITDPHDQWQGFKNLSQQGVKRIASIGGWAYSTEPATYNILRRAIIDNRNLFAQNLADFVRQEGLDGIDIDWEYPGAPDILVDGQPIGRETDGQDYLRFLAALKQRVGNDKIVAIAAPASFWYLKAFPIDRIAAIIDYIVYMTYDLHGQWDYGNPNAFDQCDSGKCIRSHVNMTETLNALGMVTKAGVPNNKIFVGESSYGRSFKMADPNCYGPLCDFTGTRIESDAKPGRCTGTSGYLANAEIEELLKRGGDGLVSFRDESSGADVLIYDGDYVSYMTPALKEMRRLLWQLWSFAGSIDWAVDLQFFSHLDMERDFEQEGSEGCISGRDLTDNTENICEYMCQFGFCPPPYCECTHFGPYQTRPSSAKPTDIVAWDEFDVAMNRLCQVSCAHGYCPPDICTTPPRRDLEYAWSDFDHRTDLKNRPAHEVMCVIYKIPPVGWTGSAQCRETCKEFIQDAEDEGRTTNYGCLGFWPGTDEIPWENLHGKEIAYGNCNCDNWLVNYFADTIIEALPAIAQIGCTILMSALKLVIDIGTTLFAPGRIITAGLDMALTAAELVNWYYHESEDPAGAFDWWLWPCGGDDLVPDEIKQAFDILGEVPPGRSSFKTPTNLRKGNGRRGDGGNPTSRGVKPPRPGSGRPSGSRPNTKCRIPAGRETQRVGGPKNTLRVQHCQGDITIQRDFVATSGRLTASTPVTVTASCQGRNSQACQHYSSVISRNPSWATLTCPPEAMSTAWREDGRATAVWQNEQRSGAGWLDKTAPGRLQLACDRDEYPPAYLMNRQNPAWVNSGVDESGQMVRYLPADQNQKAGQMWKGACFRPALMELTNAEFLRNFNRVGSATPLVRAKKNLKAEMVQGYILLGHRPQFSITQWGHSPARDDGLFDNTCWPRIAAAGDPGFALLDYDQWYTGKQRPWDYKQPR